MTVNGFMSWLDCKIEELRCSDEELKKEQWFELGILEEVERKAHENGMFCPKIRGD